MRKHVKTSIRTVSVMETNQMCGVIEQENQYLSKSKNIDTKIVKKY